MTTGLFQYVPRMPRRSTAYLRGDNRGCSTYFRLKTVLITGAATGLGEALALEFASAGSSLILLDRDQENLDDVARRCLRMANGNTSVTYHTVDVANASQMRDCTDLIAQNNPQIDVVINNAGILAAGRVADFSVDHYRTVMETNFFAVVNSTKLFRPLLLESRGGHLVNISSAFGLITAPEYSAYSASKYAVRGFTETCAAEFASEGIKVTSVLPGGLHTRISRRAILSPRVDQDRLISAFEKSIARTTPKSAALQIMKATQAGKRQVLIGPDAWLASAMSRLLGPHYIRVIAAHM